MIDFQHELDARNETCPIPLMKTKKALRDISKGEVLHVMATDPASVEDLAILIRGSKDEMLEQTKQNGEFHYYIKKG